MGGVPARDTHAVSKATEEGSKEGRVGLVPGCGDELVEDGGGDLRGERPCLLSANKKHRDDPGKAKSLVLMQ